MFNFVLLIYFFISLLFYGNAQQKGIINWKGEDIIAVTDYIVAKLKTNINLSTVKAILENNNYFIEETPDKLGIIKINIKKSQKLFGEIIEHITNFEMFDFVEPDIEIKALVEPNDPYYIYQYAPSITNAPFAWNTSIGSS